MKVPKLEVLSVRNEPHFKFDKSFGPFLNFLKEKNEQAIDIRTQFYRYLIKKFEREPQLLVPFDDAAVLEKHEDLVQLLRMSLLPLSTDSKDVPMALVFLQPARFFYSTSLFQSIFIDEDPGFDTNDDNIGHLRFFLKLILERCYHVRSDVNTRILKRIINHKKNEVRHYELNIDSRFIAVHVNGPVPEFNDAWTALLSADDSEFISAFEKFPADAFRLEGFCMVMAEDVSEDVAINQLKNAILNMHTTSTETTLNEVEVAIRELVNNSTIKIGLTPFFKINGKVVYDKSFITKCVGVVNHTQNGDAFSMDDIYKSFIDTKEPVFFSDISKNQEGSTFLCGLHYHDVKSFMVYPIRNRKELIGAFEIGSPNPGSFSNDTVQCLRPAIPLITDLVYYMLEVFDARIEQVVKEKFTPLQETVEWKFNEVAWRYIVDQENDKKASIDNVVFKNVYPLYAAVDIRNSSVERNVATKNDYLQQLRATVDILYKSLALTNLPLIETVIYKCERHIENLGELLTNEDEMNLREFLQDEVYILLKHLAEGDTSLAALVHDYLLQTDINTGNFHKNHRDYEESIEKVNKKMNDFFSAELKRLKTIYPFYFEKYKTDGIEYNIYIGNSIVPDKSFNLIYLKNLRAWQVSSMAHVTRLNSRVCNKLPLHLQTTQLILVHGTPIDISFRKDERRFDVEGAYNIRYEILKKRIDKVRIKDTRERLTQPDKIAIVYSNSTEIKEYLHHIQYLQNKGLLTDTLEMLELENPQGISGLRAVRVGVNLAENESDTTFNIDAAVMELQ